MTENDGLQHALEVEAFIASCRVDGDSGATWARVQGGKPSARRSLYHGSAGVILFYIELHRRWSKSFDVRRRPLKPAPQHTHLGNAQLDLSDGGWWLGRGERQYGLSDVAAWHITF